MRLPVETIGGGFKGRRVGRSFFERGPADAGGAVAVAVVVFEPTGDFVKSVVEAAAAKPILRDGAIWNFEIVVDAIMENAVTIDADVASVVEREAHFFRDPI